MTHIRVALVTGAAGFLGTYVVKSLLDDGYHVLALLRPKTGPNSIEQSIDGRLDALKSVLGLDSVVGARLLCIEAQLGPDMDVDAVAAAIKSALDALRTKRIDVVIHSAASLSQDHDRMKQERREKIRSGNILANVGGTTALLAALEKLVTDEAKGLKSVPDVVRIVRPSIVVGKESRTGLVALFAYYGRRTFGVRNHTLFRFLSKFYRKIPVVGNPDATIDLIDVADVMTAMMAFVRTDERADGFDIAAYTVGAFHYISTAYVHGTRQGMLMEERVVGKDNTWNNSYEESKALAEEAVCAWFTGLTGSNNLIYNNVTNEHAPTLKEIAFRMCKSVGWDEERAESALVWVGGREQLEEVIHGMWGGKGWIGRLWKTYFLRTYVLWPYILKPSGTKFDATNTKQCVGQGWTNRPLDAFISFQYDSFGPTTSVTGDVAKFKWRRLCCMS